MKRAGIFILLILLAGVLVFAQEQPSTGVGAEDVEKIQGAIEGLPMDESGEIDFDKYKPFKTKADERITAINEYVGPITKVLWGVELTLSWIFVFSVIMWILLIVLIVVPASEIFEFNVLGSLAVAAIIASLAMQGLGQNLVIWMESLATQWWIAIIVMATSLIVGIIYSMVMKYFGAEVKAGKEAAKKARMARDRAIIHASAKVEKERLKSN